MRAALFLGVMLAGGCGLSIVGEVDGISGAPDASTSPGSSTTLDAARAEGGLSSGAAPNAPNAPNAPDANAPATVDGQAGGGCVAASCPGQRCVANACAHYTDCKALHAESAVGNGVYEFERASNKALFKAYCEMTLSGGGWTLVAQSAAGETSNSFGWKQQTGAVTDTTKAYSINAAAYGLKLDEILAARGTRDAITAAYLIKPPANLATGLGASAGLIQSRTKVVNQECPNANSDSPTMFGMMGHTDRTNYFFVRDGAGTDIVVGFRPNGWDLYYSNQCDKNGGLHLVQGLLFAR